MNPPAPAAPGTVADSSASALADQLQATWDAIADLCSGLDPHQWALGTDCPGWTVADQVAHIAGTEAMLAGRDAPPDLPGEPPSHVHNDIGRANEAWIAHFRALGTDRLVPELRSLAAERLATIRAMTEDELQAPSWTPVGNATYRRFMQIRVFDCWTHEQDIRLALGRPGHLSGPAAEQSLDEVVRALGYIVGKRGAAPTGSSVLLELTGPVSRTVAVAVAERAQVVASLDGPPTTTLRMPSDVFMRLASGRSRSEAHSAAIEVGGDRELGDRIVANLAFTI